MINRAQIDVLLADVERGPSTPREHQLALALRQVISQHDFAFASWQQAVKRQGRLSVDLEITRARTHELEVTTVNKGAAIPPRFDPETAGTRVRKHSGGALVIGLNPHRKISGR